MEDPVLICISIPFLGTVLGACAALFLRSTGSVPFQKALAGFAAGIMTAASVWSLLIPAMEQAEPMGSWAFFPAAAGFWLGMAALQGLERLIPRLVKESVALSREQPAKSALLTLAVTLHNFPEGMAVGAACAGWLAGNDALTRSSMLTLAAGIAIQNIPEGAIIALPLRAEGMSRPKAFFWGGASGVVEPVGAALTILLARWLVPVLPYLLGFAAGAMLFVVIHELLPEMNGENGSDGGTFSFTLGFTLMMILDVALG